MEFGATLDLLRAGALMVRQADRSRYSWVALRTGYPAGIAVNVNTALSFRVPEGTVVPFAPYFQVMRLDGTVECWTPSHADLLAADWIEVR